MSNWAYYHHPIDKQYSLHYVAEDHSDFIDNFDSKSMKAIAYPLEREVFCIYSNTGASGTTADLATNEDELREKLDSMSQENRIFTVRLMEFYDDVQDEKDDTFEIYKDIEIDRVPEALASVKWEGAPTDIGGRLMSNLILRHSLPNANHRTAISMLEAYLEAAGLERKLPDRHTSDDEWREWVDPYITESKRLLTIRRNNVRFQTLVENGCDIIIRKGDILITLSEYDLDMHYREAWETYAKEHEENCIEFAENIVIRADRSDLCSGSGPSKSAFIEYLSSASE